MKEGSIVKIKGSNENGILLAFDEKGRTRKSQHWESGHLVSADQPER